MSSAGDASAKNNCKNGIWWKICLFAGRPALHCWFMQWSGSAAQRSLQHAALGLAAGHPARSCHTCSMGAAWGREWQPGPVPPPARSRQPGALGKPQPRAGWDVGTAQQGLWLGRAVGSWPCWGRGSWPRKLAQAAMWMALWPGHSREFGFLLWVACEQSLL